MLARMLGTLFNVGGILLGSAIGLSGRHGLSAQRESFFKITLAVFAAYCGMRLVWQGLGGSPGNVFKQMLLVMFALLIGNLAGRLLHLQSFSNRIGQHARERMGSASSGSTKRIDDGFKIGAALFCASPLGIVGAIVEGLSANSTSVVGSESVGPLAIKAAMDGLAAMGFAGLFGWSVMLSVIPVMTLQGSISLLCQRVLGPLLTAHGLTGSVQAGAGLLVLFVALVMLGLKRVPLADYLPVLVAAPLLAWWWRW
jgi:hypothetical protein